VVASRNVLNFCMNADVCVSTEEKYFEGSHV
jgi:hypothetical protein